jgi:hypothetical protein
MADEEGEATLTQRVRRWETQAQWREFLSPDRLATEQDIYYMLQQLIKTTSLLRARIKGARKRARRAGRRPGSRRLFAVVAEICMLLNCTRRCARRSTRARFQNDCQ